MVGAAGVRDRQQHAAHRRPHLLLHRLDTVQRNVAAGGGGHPVDPGLDQQPVLGEGHDGALDHRVGVGGAGVGAQQQIGKHPNQGRLGVVSLADQTRARHCLGQGVIAGLDQQPGEFQVGAQGPFRIVGAHQRPGLAVGIQDSGRIAVLAIQLREQAERLKRVRVIRQGGAEQRDGIGAGFGRAGQLSGTAQQSDAGWLGRSSAWALGGGGRRRCRMLNGLRHHASGHRVQ